MDKSIKIIKALQDIPDLDLKKDDYFVAFPMDFYSGAGVYGINDKFGWKLCACIETLDGKIQVNEVGTSNRRLITPAEFKKIVNYKIFARVIIDNNLPSVAVNELRELLSGE